MVAFRSCAVDVMMGERKNPEGHSALTEARVVRKRTNCVTNRTAFFFNLSSLPNSVAASFPTLSAPTLPSYPASDHTFKRPSSGSLHFSLVYESVHHKLLSPPTILQLKDDPIAIQSSSPQPTWYILIWISHLIMSTLCINEATIISVSQILPAMDHPTHSTPWPFDSTIPSGMYSTCILTVRRIFLSDSLINHSYNMCRLRHHISISSKTAVSSRTLSTASAHDLCLLLILPASRLQPLAENAMPS